MKLTENQGLLLVELAYLTICKKLGKAQASERISLLEQELNDDVFETVGGTFVTLKKMGSLRGCIGTFISDKSIKDGVQLNAISSAFNDYRFAPLSLDELCEIDVEVSILTHPQKLSYTDSQDLLNTLRVSIDGVILRKGTCSATFLPQVWKQLPEPEQFLTQLCLKAGLSSSAWRHENLDVETYQVQCFSQTY